MPVFSSITATGFLPSPAQILTCRSKEPVTTQLLSGSKVTAEMAASWQCTGVPTLRSCGTSIVSEPPPPSPPLAFAFEAFFGFSEILRVASVSHIQSIRSYPTE